RSRATALASLTGRGRSAMSTSAKRTPGPPNPNSSSVEAGPHTRTRAPRAASPAATERTCRPTPPALVPRTSATRRPPSPGPRPPPFSGRASLDGFPSLSDIAGHLPGEDGPQIPAVDQVCGEQEDRARGERGQGPGPDGVQLPAGAERRGGRVPGRAARGGARQPRREGARQAGDGRGAPAADENRHPPGTGDGQPGGIARSKGRDDPVPVDREDERDVGGHHHQPSRHDRGGAGRAAVARVQD